MRIEPTLMSGLQHAREHFMCARAIGRAIAPAHFSQDHGGADRLFGPPRGGVGVRDDEEREERRQFGVEVFRATPCGDTSPAWARSRRASADCSRSAMERGHRAVVAASIAISS